MKNPRWIAILILLASLTLGLVACGGEAEPTAAPVAEAATATPLPPTDAPAPTDTTPPTDTPPPVDTPTSEPDETTGELSLDEVGIPSDLSSYRATMTISISGTQAGEPIDETLSFLIEYTSDPLAQHTVMTGLGMGDSEGMDSIEVYQVEGMDYLNLGDRWLAMPSTEDSLDTTGLIEPEDVLDDTCGWKDQGQTEYNGVRVRHWTASKEDMEACMTAEQMADVGDITSASGDLYIAEEGNYVVHMNLVFEGKNLEAALGSEDEGLDEGRMEVTFDMTDVNEPIVIEVPEEALASSSLPEDIPVPEDAEEVTNAFGMITFNSPSTAAEVAEFYQTQMPQNGWTEVSVSELSGMFMLEYSKDGRTASLMIDTDEDTQMTSVFITVEEEEG